MLNTLRRRARKVGLGISKKRGTDPYGNDRFMVYDLETKAVIGGCYYCSYPLTLEDVEGILDEYEQA